MMTSFSSGGLFPSQLEQQRGYQFEVVSHDNGDFGVEIKYLPYQQGTTPINFHNIPEADFVTGQVCSLSDDLYLTSCSSTIKRLFDNLLLVVTGGNWHVINGSEPSRPVTVTHTHTPPDTH